ncbi:MAG: hypothetical protein EAX96_14785 [Candidatus Lokiarchaeota archaeon]|nr:hypothetical protein [Candidatus Lokiarchaeota archaeon]
MEKVNQLLVEGEKILWSGQPDELKKTNSYYVKSILPLVLMGISLIIVPMGIGLSINAVTRGFYTQNLWIFILIVIIGTLLGIFGIYGLIKLVPLYKNVFYYISNKRILMTSPLVKLKNNGNIHFYDDLELNSSLFKLEEQVAHISLKDIEVIKIVFKFEYRYSDSPIFKSDLRGTVREGHNVIFFPSNHENLNFYFAYVSRIEELKDIITNKLNFRLEYEKDGTSQYRS